MPAKASGSAIDAKSLVLVRSPGVVTIDLSDGAILLDELSGRSHPLRPSAKLLWACLDGISPLHEICLDIADVLDAPHEQVISDAMAFARVILDEGLATARGDASTGSMGPIHGCELCSGHTVDASVADDARWLAEAPDGCLDSRFPLGRDGEIGARLPGDGG